MAAGKRTDEDGQELLKNSCLGDSRWFQLAVGTLCETWSCTSSAARARWPPCDDSPDDADGGAPDATAAACVCLCVDQQD
jgi:hypothetical protein